MPAAMVWATLVLEMTRGYCQAFGFEDPLSDTNRLRLLIRQKEMAVDKKNYED